MHNPDSLDLLERECCNLLLRITYKPESSNTTAISEDDMFPIWLNLPACLFILTVRSN